MYFILDKKNLLLQIGFTNQEQSNFSKGIWIRNNLASYKDTNITLCYFPNITCPIPDIRINVKNKIIFNITKLLLFIFLIKEKINKYLLVKCIRYFLILINTIMFISYVNAKSIFLQKIEYNENDKNRVPSEEKIINHLLNSSRAKKIAKEKNSFSSGDIFYIPGINHYRYIPINAKSKDSDKNSTSASEFLLFVPFFEIIAFDATQNISLRKKPLFNCSQEGSGFFAFSIAPQENLIILTQDQYSLSNESFFKFVLTPKRSTEMQNICSFIPKMGNL